MKRKPFSPRPAPFVQERAMPDIPADGGCNAKTADPDGNIIRCSDDSRHPGKHTRESPAGVWEWSDSFAPRLIPAPPPISPRREAGQPVSGVPTSKPAPIATAHSAMPTVDSLKAAGAIRSDPLDDLPPPPLALSQPEDTSPTSTWAIAIGRTLNNPFNADCLNMRIGAGHPDKAKAYALIAAWKRLGWIETKGWGCYARTPKFPTKGASK